MGDGQLLGHLLALGRQARGVLAVLADVDLDESRGFELVEEGIHLGAVVGQGRRVAGGTGPS